MVDVAVTAVVMAVLVQLNTVFPTQTVPTVALDPEPLREIPVVCAGDDIIDGELALPCPTIIVPPVFTFPNPSTLNCFVPALLFIRN